MKRIVMIVAYGLVIASLVVSGHPLPAQASPASTPICGMLATATWTLAGSPYQVCGTGATVPAGATLTIEPGVSVQFDNNPGNKLLVQGALVAQGTSGQAITFSGTATPGSWGGLALLGTALTPAVASLSHATLDYGGLAGSYGAALYADNAVITLTHSLVTHSAGNGIYVAASARLDAHDTQFVDNGQHAIELSQPTTDLAMDGLSASGNGTDGVFLSGNANWTGAHHISAPGIPYVVSGSFGNLNLGDVLSIAPGNTFQFTPSGWLYVRGRFNALGTPSQPITFTGQTQTPGAWQGMFIDGGVHQAVAQLDYVTIEYGGSSPTGANIEVANGRLIVRHSLIRFSETDGVRFDVNWGGSIMESQIVDNALYGVRNITPQRHVQATNNWWGDSAGPRSDVVGCSTSLTGSRATAGVYFLPVLTNPTAAVQLPLSTAPIITLTPRRWFAPADGFTRIYFDIVVRDGNGAPLPGRTVTLASSLGTVTSGGVTNGSGRTLAWLTSNNIGDADVTASLNAVTCEGYLAPESRVTFSAPIDTTDLYPNAQSPYMANEIVVSPQPVLVGVKTTVGTTLTNPLSVPVTVDIAFGYADAGIGLVFGPLDEIVGQVIPANSTVFVSTDFLPPVSGHYCVEITYNITAIGSVTVLAPQGGGGGRRQYNLNVFQAPLGSPDSKDSLSKADNAFKLVSKLPSGPTQVQKAVVGGWWGWASRTASSISQALGFDPPRQDFDVVTVPVWHAIPPVQSGGDISVARAAALNAINQSLIDIEAYGTAATTALDRYGGASAAGNMLWASDQANAQLHYQELLGTALLTYADRLEAFVLLLESEGETETTISAGEVISYQQRLETTGFTVQEIADAQAFGLTSAQIEAHRLEIVAADPLEVAGDLLDIYTDLAAVSRELGNSLLYPPSPNFDPGFSVSGSPGFSAFGTGSQASAAGNTMVQVFNTVSTFKLSNPLTQTALVNLRPRRVDLPGDWTIDVTPAQITLSPGEITTVTVTVLSGSPTPQGIIPRLAVEGFVGSQLIGGMVIDILVPNFDPYLGQPIFLPLLLK